MHAVWAFAVSYRNKRRAAVAQTGVHVVHIDVDVRYGGHHVRDCACCRGEDIVGFGESFVPVEFGIYFAEAVVVDNQKGIDVLLKTCGACYGAVYLVHTFEEERNGDNAYREDSFLLGHAGDNRCAAGACASAHAGGDKHHLHIAGEQLLYLGYAFEGRLLAHFGFSSGTETACDLRAEKHLRGYGYGVEGLFIGVEHYKVDTFHALCVHISHCVAATAANAHGNDFRCPRGGSLGFACIFC